ncbi:MAG: carboxypeptidase-like regulatory domain-containing protein, partial [Gemmataceae bacterium]|nr:carboxypeptidase-like regulatory domain-containing protein [Gemmataceae bacterium]
YAAREWAALAPDSAAAAFHLRAAQEMRDWLPGREAFVELQEANEPGRLLPSAPVRVELLARATPPGEPKVEAIAPDDEWLAIAPAKAGKERVAFDVSLQRAAGTGRNPAPLGFLARGEAGGRGFHRKVPLPLSPRLPEIVLVPDGAAPGPATTRLALRTLPGRQPFALFVRNPIDKPWAKLAVRLGTAESLPFALGARETKRVEFPPAAPPAAGAPLPALAGSLRFSVMDMDGKAEQVASREAAVVLAQPGELVSITRARFDPGEGKNRLEVRLRLRDRAAGPDATAELQMPPLEQGGATFGEGTLRGKLPGDGGELALFADGVRGGEAARFAVGIDGWARGFVFKATLAPRAGAALPAQDDTPAVRLAVPPYGIAGPGFLAPLEIDNAPPASTVELSLGRLDGGILREELSARRASSHDERIGFALSGGLLLLEASRKDWVIPLDTSRVRGPRSLRARLLDSAGREVASAMANVVLGDEAPEVRFAGVEEKAWNKAPLVLKAIGEDRAGIASAFFFIGRPAAGKVPEGAMRAPAAALDDAKTTWSGKLPVGERKGPTEVTVAMVNKLGLTGFATATVDLTDDDPAKSKPASISGRVLEGDRPQAGLTVVLTDEKGAEKATAKTDADGKYSFKGVAPGKYRLGASKTAPPRRGGFPRVATEFLEVKPGASETADIVLFL